MTESNVNDRIFVAKLIRLVLTSRLSVREAMLSYPKDTKDESLIAAYHALIHYEADKDLRTRDILYREEQDEYLEFLSYTLEKGENLPVNIIENYKQFYDSAPVLHIKGIKGFFKSFWKNVNVKDE